MDAIIDMNGIKACLPIDGETSIWKKPSFTIRCITSVILCFMLNFGTRGPGKDDVSRDITHQAAL